jgi:hypothetical protein
MIISCMTGTDLAVLAARGDVVAQRQLREGFFAIAKECAVEHSMDAFASGEVFARLAAEHGDPDDLKRLASVLFKRAEFSWLSHSARLGLVAEAIKILTPLRAVGDPDATCALATLADQEGSCEFFDLAARMTLTENPALEVVAGAC